MSDAPRPPSQRAPSQRPAPQRVTTQRPATRSVGGARPATQQRPGTASRAASVRVGEAPQGLAGLLSRPIVLAGCAVALVVIIGLAALLRPAPHPAPMDVEEPASAPEAAADAAPAGAPDYSDAASRPAAGSAVAALVLADEAYETGNLAGARDLYLDLLLTGGDFGVDDPAAVTRWAHDRLALATARLARTPVAPLIDEPVFRFKEAAR